MNVLKIITGIACGFLIVLMSLFVFLENPEKKLYEETVESIMKQEDLSSFQEVLDSFPEVKNIKLKIERIGYLKSSIHNITGGPAPNVSKEESLYIQDCTQEIRILQNSVQENLTQVLTTYAKSYP